MRGKRTRFRSKTCKKFEGGKSRENRPLLRPIPPPSHRVCPFDVNCDIFPGRSGSLQTEQSPMVGPLPGLLFQAAPEVSEDESGEVGGGLAHGQVSQGHHITPDQRRFFSGPTTATTTECVQEPPSTTW